MSGCVYLVRNMNNGKTYIGQTRFKSPIRRWSVHINMSKRGSTFAIHSAIRKHGENSFIVESLCSVPYNALNNMEAYYAEQYESYTWDTPGGYNMVWCGGSKVARSGITMNETTRNAILASRVGSKHTNESKLKISASLKGRIMSQESIAKSASTRTGRKLSDESRAKMSVKAKGRVISEEQRRKISETLTGKPGHKHTPEICKFLSERMKGTKPTKESIEKMRQTKLAQNLKNKNRSSYGSSILTREQCDDIRAQKGIKTQKELAIQYNVSLAHLGHIQRFIYSEK